MLFYRLNMVEKLKALVDSWKHDNLVFSYNLTFVKSIAGPQIKLSQRETNYNIDVTFQHSRNSLRIIKFNLSETLELESICQPLHDAALIELMLQTLVLLVFCAQHLNKDDVDFILSMEEAKHFSCLEELFTTNSNHITLEGQCKLLTLPVWTPNSDIIFEGVKNIKVKLYQQLWSQQKSDPVLRRYLQHPNRLSIPFLKDIYRPGEQSLKVSAKTNIIPFPHVFNF